jgi:hypothetical protein
MRTFDRLSAVSYILSKEGTAKTYIVSTLSKYKLLVYLLCT